jgi:hypothetical protein
MKLTAHQTKFDSFSNHLERPVLSARPGPPLRLAGHRRPKYSAQ